MCLCRNQKQGLRIIEELSHLLRTDQDVSYEERLGWHFCLLENETKLQDLPFPGMAIPTKCKNRLPLSYRLFRPTNVSICTNPKRNGGKYSWSVRPVAWQSSHNLLADVDLSSVHLEAENQGTSREVVCTAGQWNHLLPLFLLLLEIKKIVCTEKDNVITQEQEGLWISILHNPNSGLWVSWEKSKV